MSRDKAESAHARGKGFFAAAETETYHPQGNVIGQMTPDSCVAACCRMLLRDHVADIVESHLRVALETDEEGSFVSKAPEVLRHFGLLPPYVYSANLTVDDLKQAASHGPIVAAVRFADERSWHTLLVDEFDDEWVLIRDSLPEGIGSAYKVSLTEFSRVWLVKETGYGQAVIVVE